MVSDVIIDLRGRVSRSKPNTSCCNYTTGSLIGVAINKSSEFWDVARKVREKYDYILGEESKFYLFSDFTFHKTLTTDQEVEIIKAAKLKMNGLKRHTCISNWKR